jgi:mannitol/fructose-specific phosphotransferase system IIA component (Ntr-type)
MNPFKQFFNRSRKPSGQADAIQNSVESDAGTDRTETPRQSLDEVIMFPYYNREKNFECLRAYLQYPAHSMREKAVNHFFEQGGQLKNEEERALVASCLNYKELLLPDGNSTRRLLIGMNRHGLDSEDSATGGAVYEFGFEARNRWEAIRKMVPAMCIGMELDKDTEKRQISYLEKRETSMSTAIGFGLATPHASSHDIYDLIVGYFHAREPIPWDAIDDKPVNYVACYLCPAGQFQKHLRMLGLIAKCFHKADFRDPPPLSLEEFRSRIVFHMLREPLD